MIYAFSNKISIYLFIVDSVVCQKYMPNLYGMVYLLVIRGSKHFLIKGGCNLKTFCLKKRLDNYIHILITVDRDHLRAGWILSSGIWFSLI